jgi:3-oxoacyl-[acyl-carrier-protein] synthase II
MVGSQKSSRRVVITGLGVISPIGCSKEEFWNSLAAGRSGVAKLESSGEDQPTCGGRVQAFEGRIDDFASLDGPLQKAIRKSLKLMSRQTKMGVAAAQHALADSGFVASKCDPERTGVCFGADNGSMLPEDFRPAIAACTDENGFDARRWGADGIPQVAPLWMLTCLPNMPACHVAILNDLRGPNNSITQREISANLAVAEAFRIIQDNEADAMIVGATGTTVEPVNMLHRLLDQDVSTSNDEPSTVCRPFERRRSGSVLAEGAAAFVLEELNAAVNRHANILGEIVGAGSSCVIDRFRNTHHDTSIVNAMSSALRQANIKPNTVGHLHAHGLSTRNSDTAEARAIRDVFDAHAETLPIVAAKSNMGNAGAGSGAIELAASLLALEHGHVFRVLNYEEADPECPVSVVTNDDVEAGTKFINLSTASHGRASCVVVRACA